MKIALALVCFTFTFAALGQDPLVCESQIRAADYTSYYENRTKKNAAGGPDVEGQKQAYEIGKRYLETYAEACPDQYTEAVRKFLKAYEDAQLRFDLTRHAFQAPDAAKAFETGRRILAASPEDIPTLIALAHTADAASATGNNSFVAEGLAAGGTAAQLLESGKTAASFNPYKSPQDARSYLYYYLGNLAFAHGDFTASVTSLYKAATNEGPAKSQPQTYGRLAGAYQAGALKQLTDAYNTNFAGKPESPEGTAALNETYAVMDRVIDAYARAVHYSGDDPKFAAAKAAWLESLKAFYKARHGEELANPEAIAGRPIPEPYQRK